MSHNFDPLKKYTIDELESWPDSEQWELIDGIPYLMTFPTVEHEDVSAQIRTIFNTYIRANYPNCRVYGDPAGIVLSEADNQMVRPNLFVICNPKLDHGRIQGIPNMIIEILSKSTATRDVNTKKWLYEKSGVPEYWIIDPVHQLVEIYHLQDGKYRFDKHYAKEDTVEVHAVGGLFVKLNEVFLF